VSTATALPADPEHLDEQRLERALTGEANRADVRAVFRHLIARCPECAARAADIVGRHGLLPPADAAADAPSGLYDQTFATVLAGIPEEQARMAADRLNGTLSWCALEGCTLVARRRRVAREAAYQEPGFVAAALARAEELGPTSPCQAVEVAELALLAAERLAAAGKPSAALAADLEAAALGTLGEARRQAGSLDSAREAFAAARRRLADGTGEPLGAAELLRQEARLAVETGDLADALRGLDQARRLYQQVDDRPAVGRVLLAEARILSLSDPAAALERAEEGLLLLEPADDPRADLRGFLQLAWHLVDAGRPEEARALLAMAQTDPGGRGGEPERLLRLWVSARVARALGGAEGAAPALAVVAQGWRSLGRLRPRAFATLDQAAALLEAADPRAAGTALRALARALRQRGFHDEGLQVLAGLAAAVHDERADGAACEAVADYLISAWHRPLPSPPAEGIA
jgi:tetratricopeptide (TPR) repeat protein